MKETRTVKGQRSKGRGGSAIGLYYEPLGAISPKRSNKNRRIRGERIEIGLDNSDEEIFMIIESMDKSKTLQAINSFLVQKSLEAALGENPKRVTMLRDGSLLVLVKSKKQATQLEKHKLNLGIAVRVKEHDRLNTSKGVIKCDAIAPITEKDLVEGLKEEKVKEAYIVKRKNSEGVYVNTNTAILTFDSTKIPRRINVAYYYDVKVEQ